MPKVFVKQGGVWKQVQRLWVKSNGSWVSPTAALVTQNGVGKQFYPDNIPETSYSVAGTYTYTVPSTVTSIKITGCGGGGGGGGGDWGTNYNAPDGGGGGGSNIITQTYSVSPGQVLNITVGAAGAGGPNGGEGVDGGATIVSGTTVSFNAAGGQRGGGSRNAFGGAGANGAGSGTSGGYRGSGYVTPAGLSTNGGANGGRGGGYQWGGESGQSGKLTIKPITPTTITYSNAGTYSFVVPAGITSITASVVGAGGGSGSTNSSGNIFASGGGGSGGYVQNQVIPVTPGETLTFVVGLGGYGGNYRFNSNYQYFNTVYGRTDNPGTYNGGPGGTTSISRGATILMSASGGGGGGSMGSGGTAGSPNGVAGIGDYAYNTGVCNTLMRGGVNALGIGSGGNNPQCSVGEPGQNGQIKIVYS